MNQRDFSIFIEIIESNYGKCEVLYVCPHMHWNKALGGFQCHYKQINIEPLDNCPGEREENGRKICCKLKKL